jgi:hypothetical protein
MLRFTRIAALSLAATTLAVPAMAQDLVFSVTNESGVDLVELYTSSSDSPSWEENILDGAVLPSGSTGEVTITGAEGNCNFDLRMVFADGEALEDSTDLCATSGYTIN